MPELRVDVWSDLACPWCYLGKRRLDAAIARLPSPGDVKVVWRSFELDPEAARVRRTKTSYAARLARKYRMTPSQARARVELMVSLGKKEGITFRFDRVRPGNTFDAHRVLHLARERGVQGAVKERLMHAYFGEGAALGERTALVRLAGEAGLDPAEVRRVLAGEAHADAVRADEEEAVRNGIHSVPFLVVAETYAVMGAQPVDVMHDALVQALTDARDRAAPRGTA